MNNYKCIQIYTHQYISTRLEKLQRSGVQPSQGDWRLSASWVPNWGHSSNIYHYGIEGFQRSFSWGPPRMGGSIGPPKNARVIFPSPILLCTEKSFRNLVEENQNQIVFTISDWYGTKKNSVWLQIDRKMVTTIQIWFNSTSFRKYFCVCMHTQGNNHRHLQRNVATFAWLFIGILFINTK